VVDTDERVYRDSLLTDLTDLAEFVQNHRPTAPWPPTPRSLRGGMGICSPLLVCVTPP